MGACGTARTRTSVALVLTIALQIGIAVFVLKATRVMETEWPRKIKAHADGEAVRVVHLDMFWGPVHLLVPRNCSEARLWGNVLHSPHHSFDLQVRREQMVDTTVEKAPRGKNEGEDAAVGAGGRKATRSKDDGENVVHNKDEEASKSKHAGENAAVHNRDENAPKSKDDGENAAVHNRDENAPKSKDDGENAAVHNTDEKASKSKDGGKNSALQTRAEKGSKSNDDGENAAELDKKKKLTQKPKSEIVSGTADSVDAEGKKSTERRLRLNASERLPPPAAERELALAIPLIQHIPICHKNGEQTKKMFHGPSYWNRYFSMISLSSVLTGGTHDIETLARSRRMTYWGMFGCLACTMLMKYSLKLIDMGSSLCGHKYVQLWNGGRTTIDKMIESLMIHGISIVFTLAMQLTLCTLFLTFWQGEYFIMSYIPGIGFVTFFCSFVVFTIGMVVDRVRQTMLNSSNCCIYGFWIGWVLWMLAVTVPMLGYSVYVLQFVLEIARGDWIGKEPFSDEFVKSSKVVINAVGWFTGVAAVELILILKLDLEEGKTRSSFA